MEFTDVDRGSIVNLDEIERETQKLGRLWSERLRRRNPSIFERRWWDDRILSWAMSDESVKIQMFRFVDVLPMLRNHQTITRHLQEYFEEVRGHLPWAIRLGLNISPPDTILGRALAINARSNAIRMARRFIAGTTVDEVAQTVQKLRKQGFGFTLDLLGETVISEAEADSYQQSYLRLISGLGPIVNRLPEQKQIDCDHQGPICRVNTSIKLSALCSHFRPIDPEGTTRDVLARLRPILRTAREQEAFVHIDMEHYAFKDLTLRVVREVLMEPEFRDFEDVGVVIQAYLPDSGKDLKELREWVGERGTPIWVRLVKGAYWDYETVIAIARGWPIPVYTEKWQSDANFEDQSRFLMENAHWLRPALASHNMRSLAAAVAQANHLKIPKGAYEIQMLYGMGSEQAQLLTEMGHRLRIYTPFGELIPGMAYLVRRLLENTSNDSFLRASVNENVSIEELLMKPAPSAKSKSALPKAPLGFQNEPLRDFSRSEIRKGMQETLEQVRDEFGWEFPVIIDGRPVETTARLVSINPANRLEVLGTVGCASVEDAENAIAAARKAFPAWSRLEAEYRAEYLDLIAGELRKQKEYLTALQVYEVGKPWEEADADVAEAIDFCVYYAAEMRRLKAPQSFDLPGEENWYSYRPRGVAVVIAPWNFPLAIITGMMGAAMVTGNTVVMKPAEQSPLVAAFLMQIIQDIGIPPGVVNFLPGIGEEIGPTLVNHPDVDLVTFTGSQTVGLMINEQSSTRREGQNVVKKVIAEMGGKNAIIVDDDANLDEAVLGVVHSAFGFAGQKCSACSRVIVLESVYDEFLARLIAAAGSLKIGAPEDPGTMMGPVIDDEARERIEATIEKIKTESTLIYAGSVADLVGQGSFVAPHLFVDVKPEHLVAQEEIFGPVVGVLKASSFDQALDLANRTRYALTGGVYSRSPAHLHRARSEFQVGNLYLNRPITGALVGRQPFGGFKLSGIGSKAGGPDYLMQFLIPVSISENTLRRGFAPPSDGDENS